MNNTEIVQLGEKYVMNTYARLPLAFSRGQGCRLWDADGKQYLDFLSGIAVNSLGYNHPVLIQALTGQIGRLLHTSNLYWIEPQVKAARLLAELSGLGKVFFCNSGAEANEAAIKLSRKYIKLKQGPEKFEIITFNNSFHGRTLATVTATGQTKYQQGFEPLPQGFIYAEFNNAANLKSKITEKTCAVMVEAIQGEGGIIPASNEFMLAIQELCRQHKLVLIADEVQCGLGRTGKMFAYQHYGIQPDLVTVAKGLGGGIPVGALIASDELASGFSPGDHGSTFGGNFLACTAAAAVTGYLLNNQMLATITELGDYLFDRLKQLQEKYSFIRDIRGKGLMIGIELAADTKKIQQECLENGLILNSIGHTVLRILPPYIITRADIDSAIDILSGVLEKTDQSAVNK